MHPKLKSTFKFTGRFLLGIVAVVVVYIVATLGLSHITVNSEPENSDDVEIFINSNGVHTDIVVPVRNEIKDWSKDILFAHTKANDSMMRYVAFGWGDKGFYLDTPEWSDLKASTAAKAAFYIGTSAMHTQFYRSIKLDKDCVRLTISEKDYRELVKYIIASFALDAQGKVQWIANRSYNNYDAFYEGNGKYSLFYTCNTWTNNALKAANQRAALWTTYDKGVLCHYK